MKYILVVLLWAFAATSSNAMTCGGYLRGELSLSQMLAANPWAEAYRLSLEALGDSISWVQQSDKILIGNGILSREIGNVRVTLINGYAQFGNIPGLQSMPIDFFIEFFVHPSLRENGERILVEFVARFRTRFGLGDHVKFINIFAGAPVREGENQGYYHGFILPTLHAQYEGPENSLRMSRLLVPQIPSVRPAVQGLIESFIQTAVDFPLRLVEP